MPPVEKTLPFIQNVIDIELKWLRAKNKPIKQFSFTLLALFLTLMCLGLWMQSVMLIVLAFAILIAFNLLMQYIANLAN